MSKDLCRSEDLYLHKKLSECLFRVLLQHFFLSRAREAGTPRRTDDNAFGLPHKTLTMCYQHGASSFYGRTYINVRHSPLR